MTQNIYNLELLCWVALINKTELEGKRLEGQDKLEREKKEKIWQNENWSGNNTILRL